MDPSQASYLGIEGQSVDSQVTQVYGISSGVIVTSVVSGGPAEAAGIQKGDIITQLDGRFVTSMDQLKNVLQYYAAGETVSIAVQRSNSGQYEEQTLTITLGSAADASQQ